MFGGMTACCSGEKETASPFLDSFLPLLLLLAKEEAGNDEAVEEEAGNEDGDEMAAPAPSSDVHLLLSFLPDGARLFSQIPPPAPPANLQLSTGPTASCRVPRLLWLSSAVFFTNVGLRAAAASGWLAVVLACRLRLLSPPRPHRFLLSRTSPTVPLLLPPLLPSHGKWFSFLPGFDFTRDWSPVPPSLFSLFSSEMIFVMS
jgi:hypothetical protein